MTWKIDYSKNARVFIEEHKLKEKVKESIKALILKISGESINIDLKKLKGKWEGSLRLRIGKIRVIVEVDKGEKRIYVQRIDFRGNIYQK